MPVKDKALSSPVRVEVNSPEISNTKLFGWFCLALLLRWLVCVLYPAPLYSDMQDYHRIAQEILQGKFSYAHIYRPPLYPFFLAAVYKIFGNTAKGYMAARLLQGVISAVSCWLVFKIARHLADERVAYYSYVFSVCYAPHLFFSSVLLTETLFTFFLLLTILFLLSFAGSSRPAYLVAAGIAAGLGALTRSTLLALIPFIGCWMWFSSGKKKASVAFLVFSLTVMIVLAPHVFRNYKLTGELKLTSFNGGVNFALGTGMPYAGKEQVYQEAKKRNLPLFETNTIFYRIGWQNIKKHPLAYLNRMLRKLLKFFASKYYFPFFEYRAGTAELELAHLPHNRLGLHLLHFPLAVTRIIFIFLVLPGSIFAFFPLLSREKPAQLVFRLFAAILFPYTLLHLFFIVGSARMRIPLDALFIIMFCYSWVKLAGGDFESRNSLKASRQERKGGSLVFNKQENRGC